MEPLFDSTTGETVYRVVNEEIIEISEESSDENILDKEKERVTELDENIRINSGYFYYDNYDDVIIFLPKYDKIMDNITKEYNDIMEKKLDGVYLLNTHNISNGTRFLPFIKGCKNIISNTEVHKIKNILIDYLVLLTKDNNNGFNVYKKIENYNMVEYFYVICDIVRNNDSMSNFRFYVCNNTKSITITRDFNFDVPETTGLCISKYGLFYVTMNVSFDIDDGFIFRYKFLCENIDDNIHDTLCDNLYSDNYTEYLRRYKKLNKKYCVTKLRNYYGNCFCYQLLNNC